ncbi:hypothetical protein M9458_051677, partial [Cirrhinus mrigala]
GRQQQINLRSESPACKGETTTDTKSKSPAFEAATDTTSSEPLACEERDNLRSESSSSETTADAAS